MGIRAYRLLLTVILLVAPSIAAVVADTGPERKDIRGGDHADPLAYPFVVDLRHTGVMDCTGSLITDEWIVTAAHCVDGAEATEYESIDSCSSDVRITHGGIYRYACEIVIHETYDPFELSTLAYDLALVRILPFTTRTVRPVKLVGAADFTATDIGTETWTVGLGSRGISPYRVMKVARWPLITCSDDYPSEFLCTQGSAGVIAEQGDSGSPLLIERDGEWLQIGTALRVNEETHVVAYGNLRLNADWIRSVVGDSPMTVPPPPDAGTNPTGTACEAAPPPTVILEWVDGKWTVRLQGSP